MKQASVWHARPVLRVGCATRSLGEAAHLQYHVSGRLHVVMDDGSGLEFGPGDVSYLPPGHDAWVVGNAPVVIVDISGMRDYAKH